MPSSNFADLMQPVNEALIPAIRCGLAAPWFMGPGLVLIDIVGRKSGLVRTTPLLANEVMGDLIVGTVREQSQWLKNLQSQDEAWVTNRGAKRRFTVTDPPSHLAPFLAPLKVLGYKTIYLKRHHS